MPKKSSRQTRKTKNKKDNIVIKKTQPKNEDKPVITESVHQESVKTTVKTASIIPAWKIAAKALRLLASQKGLFIGISGIYVLLSLLLVTGFAVGNQFTQLHASQGFDPAKISDTLFTYTLLFDTTGQAQNDAGGVYQVLLLIFMSLAVIYALRQVSAGVKLRLRDPFYQGMSPLIPVILVLVMIGLQMLPLIVGAGLFNLVITSGIAIYAYEIILWGLLCLALAVVTLYLLLSSVFALYIAALPDMTPLVALRSARQLVRGRRWSVLRKLVFLPVVLLLAICIIVLPFILLVPVVAPWIFLVLTVVAIPVVHSYMYSLYRELLHD